MRPPEPFGLQTVDLLRAGPAFRSSENDHRPGRTLIAAVASRRMLDGANFRHHLVERRRHLLMDGFGTITGNKMRPIAVTEKEIEQLFLSNPREDRRIGDLITVKMENGQNRAIDRGVEKLV